MLTLKIYLDKTSKKFLIQQYVKEVGEKLYLYEQMKELDRLAVETRTK